MNAVIELICVLFIAIVIHEITHYIYAVWTQNFIKIDFDEGSPTIHFDDNMSYNDQLIMYMIAIFSGFCVIVAFMLFSKNAIIHVITLIIYLFGCSYDIGQLIQLYLDHGSGRNRHTTFIAHQNTINKVVDQI
jgi:hypothetical protein